MTTHEHTDPISRNLHIVNLDNVAYVELDSGSAHIRVVFHEGTELMLNCASEEAAKNEYLQLRRSMSGAS